jgi:anti-anti-sigma factor
VTLEELAFRRLGDVVIATVKGEIDISNAASVKDGLLRAVPNTATALVLDLSNTAYVDSSGVRLIFELAERLRSRGQRLALVVPDESMIKRVLFLTEVQQVVPMSTSVQGALVD